MKQRVLRTIAMVFFFNLVMTSIIIGFNVTRIEAASKPVVNKKIKETVVSRKNKMVGKIDYDNGMTGQEAKEYRKIETTTIIWVEGDMEGQPKEGTDLKKGDGFHYVIDDKKTKRNEKIDISLSLEASAVYAKSSISATVSVPINIFKRNGKSASGVHSTSRIAQKKGCYKICGKVKYKIVTHYVFSRPDCRKVPKDKQKKLKWKKEQKYRSDTVEVLKDSSYLRYIGKAGGK